MKTVHYVIIEGKVPVEGLVCVLAENQEEANLLGAEPANWDPDYDFHSIDHLRTLPDGLVRDEAESIKVLVESKTLGLQESRSK